MRLRGPFLAGGALLLGSCASTDIAPITSVSVPREADEQQLWLQVQAQEQALLPSGFVVPPPEAADAPASPLALPPISGLTLPAR